MKEESEYCFLTLNLMNWIDSVLIIKMRNIAENRFFRLQSGNILVNLQKKLKLLLLWYHFILITFLK